MQPTRRFWTTVGVGFILLAAAVTFDRPLLVVPAAVVFAALIGAQVAFLYQLVRFDDSLSVTQSFDRPATAVDEPALLSVSASADSAGLDVSVRPRLTAGLIGDTSAGDLETTLSVPVTSPVAGTHRVQQPELCVRDSAGLFTEELHRGPEASLRVEPRTPRHVHIGEGGNTTPGAFGEHTSDIAEGGLIPAEIREYTAGDAAAKIDWKATARLATPHVRKFEGQTDFATVMVFDARPGLNLGPEGETAMAYLRAAALGYISGVKSIGDPLGCYSVEAEGIRKRATPVSSTQHYERIRQTLLELDATGPVRRRRRHPPVAARITDFDRTTTFGETLATLTAEQGTAIKTPVPLAAAVRTAITSRQGVTQIALFTDDADRAGIRDAVTEARRHDSPVVVFLAPRVLYEPGTLADLEAASERYLGFEEFRRSLAAIDGVRAFEVAPRDRIEAVLDMG